MTIKAHWRAHTNTNLPNDVIWAQWLWQEPLNTLLPCSHVMRFTATKSASPHHLRLQTQSKNAFIPSATSPNPVFNWVTLKLCRGYSCSHHLSVKEKDDELEPASLPCSHHSWKKFQKQTFHVKLMPGYQMLCFSGSHGYTVLIVDYFCLTSFHFITSGQR